MLMGAKLLRFRSQLRLSHHFIAIGHQSASLQHDVCSADLKPKRVQLHDLH